MFGCISHYLINGFIAWQVFSGLRATESAAIEVWQKDRSVTLLHGYWDYVLNVSLKTLFLQMADNNYPSGMSEKYFKAMLNTFFKVTGVMFFSMGVLWIS